MGLKDRILSHLKNKKSFSILNVNKKKSWIANTEKVKGYMMVEGFLSLVNKELLCTVLGKKYDIALMVYQLQIPISFHVVSQSKAW